MLGKGSRRANGKGVEPAQEKAVQSARAASGRGTQTVASVEAETPTEAGQSPKTVTLTHEQIVERARVLWQQRGCRPGEDERNWYEAEAQLKRELGSS
jgi:hypothetical protein